MPDLPNSSIASAVFCAPSGILANLSATSSMTLSKGRILPLASLALTPIDFNASLAFDAGSTIPFDSLPIALATSSTLLPESFAAAPNLLRLSTATPVRWLKSLRLSAASIDPFASVASPPIAIAGTRAPSAPLIAPAPPLSLPKLLFSPSAFLSRLVRLFSRPLIEAVPSTLAWILTAALMSSAIG